MDVLFEETHYVNVIEAPIQSRFLKQQGEPVMVKLPSKEDLLGDKLTAFAPHTTGIPFFKGDKTVYAEGWVITAGIEKFISLVDASLHLL